MNDRPPPRWHKPIDAAGDHPLTSFVLFIFVLMLLGVVSAIRSDQEPINTDMLSLVGFTDADPVRAAGTKRIGDYAERRQTWIVSHPQLDQAYLAAEALQADLADSDLYDLSQATAQVTDADVLAIYEAYRYQLA
ncbi:MAG: hypothetical protein O7F71_06340, partial [Gammaproteobacteria bacterium]|nr:hypothetical protein [Gammaproteobacteria bacterium]